MTVAHDLLDQRSPGTGSMRALSARAISPTVRRINSRAASTSVVASAISWRIAPCSTALMRPTPTGFVGLLGVRPATSQAQ